MACKNMKKNEIFYSYVDDGKIIQIRQSQHPLCEEEEINV